MYFDNFIKIKWFKPLSYDHKLMRIQRMPIKGDFNWIFDDTILALASPISDIPFNPHAPNKLGFIYFHFFNSKIHFLLIQWFSI